MAATGVFRAIGTNFITGAGVASVVHPALEIESM